MATLSERYVAAVSRRVPAAQRADVELEVAAAVDDLVTARREDGSEPAVAEREALLELGDPVRLAAGYSGRQLQLIGPGLYPDYVRLLAILLGTIVPVVTIAVFLGTLFFNGDPGETASATVLTALSTTGHVLFWTTGAFALVERAGTTRSPVDWSPEMLRDLPQQGPARLGDTAASIVLLVGTAAYLVWQHFRSPIHDAEGSAVPLLDPALWAFWLPYLIVVLLAGATLEWLRYRARGWTWAFFTAKAVIDLAFAVPVIVLAASGSLFNPAFTSAVDWWPEAGGPVAVIVLACTAGVLLWDIADAARKTPRDQRALRDLRAGVSPARPS
ncbi:hypothetical protein [Arthrobacter sp. JSM 101049]|uniref:hypothetical protein n=1 Tax=Arthrobacter sp. JSM 101049 TaxID=929097 RepID=UPI003568AF7D